jgi:hypothetical protein
MLMIHDNIELIRSGSLARPHTLTPGEHIQGWVDVAKFERLSFNHRIPAFNEVRGGVTPYEDEFGD